MFLRVRSAPFSFAEFPFSPPFSKQNGGELALGSIRERSRECTFRRTLAEPGLSERWGKQLRHSFPISDFLRTSRPEARPSQPRSGARLIARQMLSIHSMRRAVFHHEPLALLHSSASTVTHAFAP